MKGQAAFTIEDWTEKVYSEEEDGGKLAHVHAGKSYRGDIEGEGILAYLMIYRSDGSAEFYGLERVTGRVGEHEGSFVWEHRGSFKGGMMEQTSVVVEGSGTGDLSSLQGKCSISAGHQQEYPFTFEYKLG